MKTTKRLIRASQRYTTTVAAGLPERSHVVIECDGTPTEGIVIDGRMVVGGCLTSPGMLGRVLTLPWRSRGGDLWTMARGDVVAILGDGTDVRLGEQDGGCYRFEAAGKTYRCINNAAMELTPAR